MKKICILPAGLVAAIVSIILLFSSCRNQSGTGLIPDEHFPVQTFQDFRITLNVTDPSGRPVPGLLIQVRNHLSSDGIDVNTPLKNGNNPLSIQRTTAILMSIPKISICNLEILDLQNELIGDLINNRMMPPGVYKINWSPDELPNGVYRIRLTAADSGNRSIRYRHSIMATISGFDAGSVIGVTSPAGRFETTNPLIFPSLFRLPPQPHINISGDSIGTFDVLGMVTITLTDPVSGMSQSYDECIQDRAINLVYRWQNPIRPSAVMTDPAVGKYNRDVLHRTAGRCSLSDIGPGSWPSEFKLFQNYPNPFF